MNSSSAPVAYTLKKDVACKLQAISERTLENRVKARDFPPPVFIGNYCDWSEKIVPQWYQRKFGPQTTTASGARHA